MMRKLNVGGFYKHFKGGIYQVIELAKHTENGSSLVIYRSTENGQVFARPLDMFMSEVDTEKYPEIEQKYRLEEIKLEEESIAVMPRDFDKWKVIDIKVEVPHEKMASVPSAVNHLLGNLISELIKCKEIPWTSYKDFEENEIFRLRFPVGPWINTLK